MKIIILNSKINITDFDSIDCFDDNKIILRKDKEYVVITGSNLVITRLVIDEILISGNIKIIEFR